MSDFTFSQSDYTLFVSNIPDNKCYQYAVSELCRLAKRINITLTVETLSDETGFQLSLNRFEPTPFYPTDDEFFDSFHISVREDAIQLTSQSAKGILNAVYDLMEQVGFTYLLPGDDGEWPPENGAQALTLGPQQHLPRFPYRGVFWQPLNTNDFSHDEWLRFYAKLKFNALSCKIDDLPLCDELGLRLEIGGHGFSHLLPRELFDEKPELFRMFQPEDFRGRRMDDSNMCITNAETRKIVKENFKKSLQDSKGAYAIHAWADDLPAGGWCLCPTCRSFSPEDQSMLAMRLLSEACQEADSDIRIPVIAYHDTMYPGKNIDPCQNNFLLYAPRERCYGHALDDPSCERNKFYMKALKEWQEQFDGISDSHTFEYYFDQILFRGIYPFLPQIIIDDMTVYEQHDIKTHLSLQVAGPAISPEYNMLVFSQAHWQQGIDDNRFCQQMGEMISANFATAWSSYLTERSQAFTKAMQMCDFDVTIYLDYRWLPESTTEFGIKQAEIYKQASQSLDQAATQLEQAVTEEWPERLQKLAQQETKRARFEAAELLVMHYQLAAMNEFAATLNTNDKSKATAGCKNLEQAIEQFKTAKVLAEEFGIPENCWYFSNINKWLTEEFQKKIANYQAI